jgi:hypothetical protein
MLVQDQIKALVASNADSDGYVSLPLLEEKMKESGFDMEGTGYTYDMLLAMLEDLDAFEIDKEQSPVGVRCKGFEPVATSPAVSAPPVASVAPVKQTSFSADEDAVLNRRIVSAIKKLLKFNPSSDGTVLLTNLGAELRFQDIRLPNGEKLTSYLRRYPTLFEIDSETRFVRVLASSASAPATAVAPPAPLSPSPAPSPAAEKPKALSLYNLFDFCFFPDYRMALTSLSKMAVPDGWFVLDEPGHPDPCHLLGLKLQSDFAFAVKDQLEGVGARISISLDKASFKTCFHTDKNELVSMHFILNRNRPGKMWQTWLFDHFSVEEA